MSDSINPLYAGEAASVVTAFHAYGSGGKTAGAIASDIKVARAVSVVENFRRAIGLRVEATPAEVTAAMLPYVGQGNGSVKIVLTDGTYSSS
jgi:hypothetical protein